MPLLIAKKTKFVRKHKNGVARIVRDSYSNDKGGWFDHSRKIKTLDGKCLDCGHTADQTPEGTLQCHHIKPLSRGGTTTKLNLITLCETCHHRRHKGNHNMNKKGKKK